MNHLFMLNKLKSLALGLDEFFKKNGQPSIKFHQATSAVYQSAYKIIQGGSHVSLQAIFGDFSDDKVSMELMEAVLGEFVDSFVAAGTDDMALNRASYNFRILDQEGRFPLRIEPEKSSSDFQGRVVVTSAFNVDTKPNVGELVNVSLSINPDDAEKLVDIVREQLEAIGLVIGRLTSTDNKIERHVSLALRIPFSNALNETVNALNNEINSHVFRTAGQLKVVTPTDIRTSQSAVELLDENTCKILRQWQIMLHESAGQVGNKLPPLHITHGNSPIQPASINEISELQIHSGEILEKTLEEYGLNLSAAYESYDLNSSKSRSPVISGNRSALINNFGSSSLDEQKADVKHEPMKMNFNG